MRRPARLTLLSALAFQAAALSVPTNVRGLYNSIKNSTSCGYTLASGFWSTDSSGPSSVYCGDHLADSNVIYLRGNGSEFVNMDVDCDGLQKGVGDDGSCGSSRDTQSVTSFRPTLKAYNQGVSELNAYVHSYIVFGNMGTKKNWATFDPETFGVLPLSVMAVVCGDQMFYGIWGDENGDDGTHPMVGEASISLAKACYGSKINGNYGHDDNDVLYLAFPGDKAVPGAKGAKWNASSFDEFHSSIQALGDSLVAGINGTSPGTVGGNNGTTNSSNDSAQMAACAGAKLSTIISPLLSIVMLVRVF